MSILKSAAKVIIALGPAIASFGQALKEKWDVRNYGTLTSLKDHARQEKYEAKCLMLSDNITDDVMKLFDTAQIDQSTNKHLYKNIEKYRAYRSRC